MALTSVYTPVNFGDTSLRRKNVVEVYKEMATTLWRHRGDQRWNRNPDFQADIYKHIVDEGGSFKVSAGESLADSSCAQRARTYTNALSKAGLCDRERRLTALGTALITGEWDFDRFEKNARLGVENSIMLRGLTSFSQEGQTAFYPFLLLLNLMKVFEGSLSTDEVNWALIVAPTRDNFGLEMVVEGIHELRSGTQFDSLLIRTAKPVEPSLSKAFIETGAQVDGLFPNAKGPKMVERYWSFISALEAFRSTPNNETLNAVRAAASDSSAKNAFLTTEYLPHRKVLKEGPDVYHSKVRYPGFHDADPSMFRDSLVRIFTIGKELALVSEYADNNRRILSTTGLFSLENHRMEIKDIFVREYIKGLDEIPFTGPLVSAAPFPSFDELFGEDQVHRTFASLESRFGLTSDDPISEFLDRQRRERFEASVQKHFPAEHVRALLRKISDGYTEGISPRSLELEKLVKETFETEPTVPTAYEYLIGLSAYYSSGRTADPLALFGMGLNADYLPLSPAPGLRGDIEVITPTTALLIEVTLMNPANQRRNEMEPVLRHATNFMAEHSDKRSVRTLFIANQIDKNVNTVLSFARFMPLSPTQVDSADFYNPVIECRSTDQWLRATADDSDLNQILDREFSPVEMALEDLYKKLTRDQKFVTSTSDVGPDFLR